MPASVDVSIVVIAFNEQTTIEACVSALLAQVTPRSLEVVVVDDGSSDRTASLVRELARRDPRVRMLTHANNRGRGAARRTGQDATHAALIGYVDADVIVPADWLERCATALGTHGAVSGTAVPDGDCVVLVRLVHPSIRVRPHTMPISGGNVLFEATALHSVGFDARSRLGEDFRLARRMTELGYTIATVPGLVSEHRETKTYRSTMRWMWQNGRDAARLPFEFRILRVPDVTWIVWVAVLVALAAAAATGSLSLALGAFGIVACTVAIGIGHATSRFRFSPNPLRWLAAAALDVPLVTSYLAGRTAGFPGAVGRARVRP